MRLISATVAGMLTATFLWYFVNGFVQDAGIGFVRGHGWPVSTAWLAAAVGAAAGLVNHSRGRREQKRRAAGAESAAADLGLAFTPTVERPAAALPCFANWYSGKDGNTGVVDGVPVSVFDMTSCIESSEGGDSYPSHTVVLVPAVGLPEFTAGPRSLGSRLTDAFGGGGMTFDPAAAGDAAEVVRRFGRAVWVDPRGSPGPFEPATAAHLASETTVRRLFTTALMSALLDQPDWSYEANGEWLACYRRKVVRPAGERPHLIAGAVRIRAALLAAAADPPPAGLPPLPLPTPGQYRSRGFGTLAGVVLGMAGGLFGGGAAVSEWDLLKVVWLLAVAVGVVTGGVLGYWVGAAIGLLPAVKRWSPPPAGTPEQQAETRRRSRWQTGCGCVG